MAKKETAEQKLLKIIESQNAAEQPSSTQASPGQEVASQVASSVKGLGLPCLALPPVLAPLLGLLKGLTLAKSGVPFGFREINKLFILAIAVVCVFFVANVLGGMKLLHQKITFAIGSQTESFSEDFVPPLLDLAAYLENIKRRNIFRPFEKKQEAQPMTAVVSSTQKIEAILKELKLVGLSWLDTPESASVMIEDTVSGITYFYQQGDKVRELTIKAIYRDRVILTYEDEELVLKL